MFRRTAATLLIRRSCGTQVGRLTGRWRFRPIAMTVIRYMCRERSGRTEITHWWFKASAARERRPLWGRRRLSCGWRSSDRKIISEPEPKMAIERKHTYHAEADVLSAKLERPLQAEVRPQAYVKLPEHGGYFSERAENFRLESVISFRSAYTQVAGNRSEKEGRGWVTLATA